MTQFVMLELSVLLFIKVGNIVNYDCWVHHNLLFSVLEVKIEYILSQMIL